jgi:hypothetical protein
MTNILSDNNIRAHFTAYPYLEDMYCLWSEDRNSYTYISNINNDTDMFSKRTISIMPLFYELELVQKLTTESITYKRITRDKLNILYFALKHIDVDVVFFTLTDRRDIGLEKLHIAKENKKEFLHILLSSK